MWKKPWAPTKKWFRAINRLFGVEHLFDDEGKLKPVARYDWRAIERWR